MGSALVIFGKIGARGIRLRNGRRRGDRLYRDFYDDAGPSQASPSERSNLSPWKPSSDMMKEPNHQCCVVDKRESLHFFFFFLHGWNRRGPKLGFRVSEEEKAAPVERLEVDPHGGIPRVITEEPSNRSDRR